MVKTSTDALCLLHQFKFREMRATRWLLWHTDFTKFDFGRGDTFPHFPPLDAVGVSMSTRGSVPSPAKPTKIQDAAAQLPT